MFVYSTISLTQTVLHSFRLISVASSVRARDRAGSDVDTVVEIRIDVWVDVCINISIAKSIMTLWSLIASSDMGVGSNVRVDVWVHIWIDVGIPNAIVNGSRRVSGGQRPFKTELKNVGQSNQSCIIKSGPKSRNNFMFSLNQDLKMKPVSLIY